MTLVEIRFRLQTPLTSAQLKTLSDFSNTYGLRRFHVTEDGNVLQFEYDASRLRQTQVAHVLREARIAVSEQLT
jgi:hypothetical protein